MRLDTKFTRARKLQRERQGLDTEEGRKREQEAMDSLNANNEKLTEKGDIPAMTAAAFFTLFLPAALVVLLIGAFFWILASLL